MATLEETINYILDNGDNMSKEINKFVLKVFFIKQNLSVE
jgi:hypothetical protein